MPRGGDRPAAEPARERILRAAVKEFGAKGYAGARTAGIAARAGVNQQLISYYFGGKRGLLEELRRRWARTEATLAPPDAGFAESLAAYLDATLERPDWARLVIWQALGDDPGLAGRGPDRPGGGAGGAGGPHDTGGPGDTGGWAEAQRARLSAGVERIRRRQRAGEIADDIDARFVLLLAYAVTFAPIAMPQVVAGIFDVDPCSPEYRRRCRDELVRLVQPGRRDEARRQAPPETGGDHE